MKRILIVIVFIAMGLSAYSQEGVHFESLTLEQALVKAKAENKFVFVDCYTSWCGPCKYMANTVFTQKEAGDFFNPRFISVKFDMEKEEGKELGEKYPVRAYPTFLILRPDGGIQHIIVGGGRLDFFINKVEKGLGKKTSLFYLEKQYEKGKISTKELAEYQMALIEAGDKDKSAKIGKELEIRVKPKDKMKADFWPVIEKQGARSDNFQFVVDHLPTFVKNVEKARVDSFLFQNYESYIFAYIYDRSKKTGLEAQKDLERMHEELSRIEMEGGDYLRQNLALADAYFHRDIEQMVLLAERFFQNVNTDSHWRPVYYANMGKWGLVHCFEMLASKLTKEQCNRIANLGEPSITYTEDAKEREVIASFFEQFKIAGYTGVYFRELAFENVWAKVKREKKKIFIYCYTTSSDPCKEMTENVFLQEKMGEYLNSKFICLKYDMEKGEGPELMKRFGVRAFPTFVILNQDGSLCHKWVGGGEPDDFIKCVEESFDENTTLGFMDVKCVW